MALGTAELDNSNRPCVYANEDDNDDDDDDDEGMTKALTVYLFILHVLCN